ncbi:MAG TPA: FAD-dependent oxidoreductase, partial [Polyangiales bacterium]
MPNIVIIGGVAAGSSAASQAKRRQPEADVVLLEKGSFVSYGACGIPYNLQEPARMIEDLIAVSVRDFRDKRHIDLRTHHEVTRIDSRAKRLHVRDLAQGRDYSEAYDKLVIATGASSAPLPLPGVDLPGVFALRELSDGQRIKQFIADRQPKSALIIGGGYIAMEMAETLRARGM